MVNNVIALSPADTANVAPVDGAVVDDTARYAINGTSPNTENEANVTRPARMQQHVFNTYLHKIRARSATHVRAHTHAHALDIIVQTDTMKTQTEPLHKRNRKITRSNNTNHINNTNTNKTKHNRHHHHHQATTTTAHRASLGSRRRQWASTPAPPPS